MMHADLLKQLLPPTSYSPNGVVLGAELAAEGAALDTALAAGDKLLDESDPRSTLQMLTDWERVLGLPDACSLGVATTLQERRSAVVAKITARGGSTLAWFQALAVSLGYTVTIETYKPFRAGISRCGDRLNGGASVRYYWRVRVSGPRTTLFRTGASQAGDKLGKIARATDLECRLTKLKPAHTYLIVSYEGV